MRAPFLYAAALLGVLPALLVGLPVLIANAIAHRGLRRAFFTQERVGRHGRVFVIVKFRTMRGTSSDGPDALRVTRLGRLLRNTHLDELPQLWNLLRGEMTLIGARPEMVTIHEWARERIPGYAERLELPPGLTGLAQITQGYAAAGDEIAYTRKARLDVAYARSITFLGDLAILARTVAWVLRARGWRGRLAEHAVASVDARESSRLAA